MVHRTSELTALFRASDAPPNVDPFAPHFLSEATQALIPFFQERPSPPITVYVRMRHRYIDDLLKHALEQRVEQVLIVGAGFDSRVLRFAVKLDGRPVFEVDLPDIIKTKAQQLDDLCRTSARRRPVQVPVILGVEELSGPLIAAGFCRDRRTLLIMEGVLMYLPRSTARTCLEELSSLAPAGSELIADFWSWMHQDPTLVTLRHQQILQTLDPWAAPLQFSMHLDDVALFLAHRGYAPLKVVTAANLERRFQVQTRADPSFYVVHAEVSFGARPHRSGTAGGLH
jgi:methyltransferase (TIGR00027 family)